MLKTASLFLTGTPLHETPVVLAGPLSTPPPISPHPSDLCSWQSRCDQDPCWQRAVRSPAGIAVSIGCTFLGQRRAVSHTAVPSGFTFPSFKPSFEVGRGEDPENNKNSRRWFSSCLLFSLRCFMLKLQGDIWRQVFTAEVVFYFAAAVLVKPVFKLFQPQKVNQGASTCVREEGFIILPT